MGKMALNSFAINFKFTLFIMTDIVKHNINSNLKRGLIFRYDEVYNNNVVKN